MSEEIKFRGVPPDMFPFTIEYLNSAGAVIHTEQVTAPGVLSVPNLVDLWGPISVRMLWPDGSVTPQGPP